MSMFPPAQAPQAQTGNIEVDLQWNGDFSLQANGDLVLAFDLTANPSATTERITRLLYTNPRVKNPTGTGYISAGDDMFNNDYGVGLPSKVGSMFAGAAAQSQGQISATLAKIKALAANGLAADPSILQNPPPFVSVNPDAQNISQIDILVGCTAVTGQIIVVPSSPITGS